MTSERLFQELLRSARRIRGDDWVDIEEELRFEELIASYDGTSRVEFRAAVASLLARSPDEARKIEEAFDRLYPAQPSVEREQPAKASAPAPSPNPTPRAGPAKRGIPLLGIALILAGLAAVVAGFQDGPEWRRGEPLEVRPEPVPVPPVPIPPVLREPVRSFELGAFTIGTAVLFGAGGLLLLGLLRARRRLSEWNQGRWRRFAKLEGARDYRVDSEPVAPVNDAVNVDRLTSALELAAGAFQPTRRLDVRETVARTARNVLVEPVFEKRAAVGRVLVLRDTSATMAPWRHKVERFVEDLKEQTVVDLLYFDSTPARVTDRSSKEPQSLRSLFTCFGDLPLLMISTGAFLQKSAQPIAEVRAELAGWPIRVILNPVEDRALWPDALRREPPAFASFPMNEEGYRAVSRWLQDRARQARRELKLSSPALLSEDVLRLLAMLSFLPRPSLSLAELMRSELMPDTPDSVLLALDAVIHPTALTAPEVFEARRWLRDRYAHSPNEAESFRAFLKRHVPVPTEGSPAWQRYMRDQAVLELNLATGPRDYERVERYLAAFADSPLVDGWTEELRRAEQRPSPGAAEQMTRLQQRTSAAAIGGRPRRWALPSLPSQAGVLLSAGLVLFAMVTVSGPPTPPDPIPTAPPDAEAPAKCDKTDCAGACVDLTSDPNHCGACGKACDEGQVCRAGRCECAPPSTSCNGRCVNTSQDPGNCGACGRSCGAEGACVNGTCVACAGAGKTRCKTGCADLTTDPRNCGACGSLCQRPHARARCVDSQCQLAGCTAGWSDCDNSMANGCEVDLRNDVAACGLCGNRCGAVPHGQPACEDGICSIDRCEASWGDCDDNLANGCETDLRTMNNCGGCGEACSPRTERCVMGNCRALSGLPPTCPPDRRLCNNRCIDTQSDFLNCGGCGISCPKGAECRSGICVALRSCTDSCKDQFRKCMASCPAPAPDAPSGAELSIGRSSFFAAPEAAAPEKPPAAAAPVITPGRCEDGCNANLKACTQRCAPAAAGSKAAPKR